LAHEQAAFDARGVTIVGLSDDEPEDSREFAESHGIDFPLVYDEDARYASQLVGVDTDGNALPSVVVLLPGRRIHFRKTAEVKDDRVHAAQMLTIVDDALRAMGSTPPARDALRGGYAPQARWQLGLGFEVGERFSLGDDDRSSDPLNAADAALGGNAMLQAPLGRYATAGPRVGFVAGADLRLDLSAAARIRVPVTDDLGEVYLLMPVGLSIDPTGDEPRPHDTVGVHGGGRLGLQFALWPAWAPFVDVGVMARRFGAEGAGPEQLDLFASASLGMIYLP
jgi:hypothetical protein